MYQLCKRDEYGQTSIEASSNSYQALVKKGKEMVTQENVENALTTDYKLLEWESYFVEFVDENGEAFDTVVYAGPSGPAGKKQVYVIGEGDEFKVLSLDEVECNPRFFVGNEDKGASSRVNPLYALGWYVEVDPATKRKSRIRRVIDNFDHDELERKSVFYIIKK